MIGAVVLAKFLRMRSRRTPARNARGAAALVGLAMLAAGGAGADDAAFTSKGSLDNMNGEQIYAHICQGCHMPGGQGAEGAARYPKLAGDPALVSWEYAAITVLNGKDNMPAFGLAPAQVEFIRSAHLSDAQVADIVNYVRKNFGNHFKGTVTAAEVAKLPHP
jgi:mono/diheme cytochrome c family protein